MKKRILSIVLSTVMALSVMPTMASAVTETPSGEGWHWVADAQGEAFTVTTQNIEAAGTAPKVLHDIGGSVGDNIEWVLDTAGTLTISGSEEWTELGSWPWNDYKVAIKSVVIEEGVTHIGAKDKCVLPMSIAGGPFYNCVNLTDVKIADSVKYIDNYAFYRCPIKSVNVPAGVEEIGVSAFGGFAGFQSINVDAANPNYSSVGGVLFDKNQTTLIKYPAGKNGNEYVIPDGVTKIDDEAFMGCANLKKLTLSETVEEVEYRGASAFLRLGTFPIEQLESITVLSPEFSASITRALWDEESNSRITIFGYRGSLIEKRVSGYPNVTFVPLEGANPLYKFTDVTDKATYHDAVKFAVDNGLFNGTSETTFSPDAPMTRAMFVTVLGRYAKADTASYKKSTFTDSVAGQWYAPYVEWAAANNIVGGYGNGVFGVNDNITLEQICVILSRLADNKDAPGKSENEADKYLLYYYQRADSDVSVHDWAADSVKWAINNGICTSKFKELAPTSPASRALVAEMMQAFSLAYGN